MRTLKWFGLVYAGLALGFGSLAGATVSLSFNTLQVTIDKLLQNPPEATVTLNIVPTGSEQMTGLDYYLTALGGANGYFILFDRNISTSPFNDLFNDDSAVEASPANQLNPTTDLDLGGNSNTPQTGTKLVAIYKLRLKPDLNNSYAYVPNGSYVIETFSPPGQGWADQLGNDNSFTSQASLNILVVPEPAMVGLLGFGALALMRRRGRAA